jgi:AbrB family transcriptional regulator (stage V sporulation protein T)
MKTTGIVRRIDELGRVVIPKELRRTMHLKEGEEMEVFVSADNSLVLKKYSAIKELAEFGQEYVDIVYQITNSNCLICDLDNFIACSTDKNIYIDNRISKALEKFLVERKPAYLRSDSVLDLIIDENKRYKDMAISPILVNGDVVGGVILVSTVGLGEISLKLVEVASGFLSKQV